MDYSSLYLKELSKASSQTEVQAYLLSGDVILVCNFTPVVKGLYTVMLKANTRELYFTSWMYSEEREKPVSGECWFQEVAEFTSNTDTYSPAAACQLSIDYYLIDII